MVMARIKDSNFFRLLKYQIYRRQNDQEYRLNSKEESLLSMWLYIGKTRDVIVLISLLSSPYFIGKT